MAWRGEAWRGVAWREAVECIALREVGSNEHAEGPGRLEVIKLAVNTPPPPPPPPWSDSVTATRTLALQHSHVSLKYCGCFGRVQTGDKRTWRDCKCTY